MSNKKRIHKKQKSITSYSEAKAWECIALALKAVNNAIDLQREKLRATQLNKSNFPSGIIISNEQEKIPAEGCKFNPIIHSGYNQMMELEELYSENWREYCEKEKQRIQIELPKQLEGMMALVRTPEGGTKSVFAGSRDYVAKQNIK